MFNLEFEVKQEEESGMSGAYWRLLSNFAKELLERGLRGVSMASGVCVLVGQGEVFIQPHNVCYSVGALSSPT